MNSIGSDFTAKFPTEISLFVFSFFDLKELVRYMQVCKRWQKLAQTQSLWTKTAEILVINVISFENVKKEVAHLRSTINKAFCEAFQNPKSYQFMQNALLSSEVLNDDQVSEVSKKLEERAQLLLNGEIAAQRLRKLKLISDKNLSHFHGELKNADVLVGHNGIGC